ncbi:MAG: hypothetical protein [Cotesia congregata filamentous virus 2]
MHSLDVVLIIFFFTKKIFNMPSLLLINELLNGDSTNYKPISTYYGWSGMRMRGVCFLNLYDAIIIIYPCRLC